jgi:hypothetical protein
MRADHNLLKTPDFATASKPTSPAVLQPGRLEGAANPNISAAPNERPTLSLPLKTISLAEMIEPKQGEKKWQS